MRPDLRTGYADGERTSQSQGGSSPGLGMPVAQGRDAWDSRIPLCLPGSAEGLRWHPLSEIEKPGSGTEPIHQEHVMCSRFRGSCPSDVKSAGHPEPGFPIPLSGSTAALCAPGETQKNPAARSIPEHRHTPALKQRAYPNPRKNQRLGMGTGRRADGVSCGCPPLFLPDLRRILCKNRIDVPPKSSYNEK